MAGGDVDVVRRELEAEMAKMLQHFDRDDGESASKLVRALEQESTAAALHFALFPSRTRDGGGRPQPSSRRYLVTCRRSSHAADEQFALVDHFLGQV